MYPRTPATALVVVPSRAALPEKRVVSPLPEGEITGVAGEANVAWYQKYTSNREHQDAEVHS